MKDKEYNNVSIEKMPGSRVKITGEISKEKFEKARKSAFIGFANTVEIPGFRAGKAPENIVRKHIGDMKILERAAETAINDVYNDLIEDNNVRAIGMPKISITKIAENNPLGFTLETAVMPEISISNSKALAKEAMSSITDKNTDVTKEEIDAVIMDIRKQLAKGSENENQLPELNEETLKKLGDFKDVEALTEKIKENISARKEFEIKDKKRAAVAEKLIASANFDVPDVIVESELDTMLNQFRADIEKNGYTLNSYLEQINKKEEDIRKEWRGSAERRARLELILKHISKTEKISPSEEEVKKEVDQIISHHKDADRFRVRMYVENLLTNQKVFDYLES